MNPATGSEFITIYRSRNRVALGLWYRPVPTHQATLAGGIVSLESNPGLLKRLQIRARAVRREVKYFSFFHDLADRGRHSETSISESKRRTNQSRWS